MSGFLASLAARCIGRERVLEPRRLLFEPREEPPLDAGSGLEPGAAHLTPAQPPPAPREPAGPRPTTAATNPPTPRREARGDERRPGVAPAESVPRRRRPRAAEPVHVRDDVAPSPDARPEPLGPHPVTVHVERPAPRDAPASLVDMPRRVRAELAERGPASRPDVMRPPLVAAPRAPAGPDLVRITIGRVDVRAVHAPEEKAPVHAPAPPRMTLDEYLARGRRR
jgi:hypothetical protein